MKMGMTIREKVLLVVLAILILVLAYYYALYLPVQNEIARCEEEYLTIDESILLAEAKTTKLNKMKTELESIKAGEGVDVKPLPAYDNRQQMMIQLSTILSKTENYNITYGNDMVDGVTVNRAVKLDYTCESYEDAKQILEEIYEGEYPCVFGNLFLSNGGRSVSVDITYFEYQ